MQVKLVCFSKKELSSFAELIKIYSDIKLENGVIKAIKSFFMLIGEYYFTKLIKFYNIKNKQVKDGFNCNHIGLFLTKQIFANGGYVEKEFFYEAVELFTEIELDRARLQKKYYFIEFVFNVSDNIVDDLLNLVNNNTKYSLLKATASANTVAFFGKYGNYINKFLNFLRTIFTSNKKEVFCVSSVLFLILKNMSNEDFIRFHEYYVYYIKNNFLEQENDSIGILNNLTIGEFLHKYEIANETDPAVLYNILKSYYFNNIVQ